MNARLLRAADYRRMRWQNGAGWTTELARASSPEANAAFDWRISIAEVESDGAFSVFPDCDRYIALLEGAGMRIAFDDGDEIELEQRLKFFAFNGERNAHGYLRAGPVRDFNVIVKRERCTAEVLVRPLVGPMVFLPEPMTTWFVYLAAGNAVLKDSGDIELSAGESLLLEPGEPRHNHVLNGGGEVVLVKLVAQDARVGR